MKASGYFFLRGCGGKNNIVESEFFKLVQSIEIPINSDVSEILRIAFVGYV